MAKQLTALTKMGITYMQMTGKEAVKQGKSVFMCRIYGEATDSKTKEDRTGRPYTYLIGQFRGVNNKGEEFESEKLFLPDGIMEKVLSQLAQAEGAPVKFGYDITSAVNDKSSVGYNYVATTIIKTETSDRLKDMEASLPALPAATAAPEDTKKKKG